MLNTIMADSLDYMATVLEKAVENGEDFDVAVQKLLTDIITEHGAVVFNGDGYSENWQIEAAERGLPNLKTTLDALPELIKPESIELFEKYSVFSDRELHSRYEVRLEMYALTIGVEAKLALELGSTVILPSAVRYQTELAQNVAALKKAGVAPDMTMLEAVSTPISELTAALAALKAGLAEHGGDSAAEEAAHAQSLLPKMDAVRAAADNKCVEEGIVERLGLYHKPGRRPYRSSLLRDKMNVVAALAKLRVGDLEDGHCREAHHVKTWKGHYSYSLQANLPPSVISITLFGNRATQALCRSDRGIGHWPITASGGSPG